MKQFTWILVGVLVLGTNGVAQTPATTQSAPAPAISRSESSVTPDEYDKYAKLRYAHAVANAKRAFASGGDEQASVEQELEREHATLGWTREKFAKVDAALKEVAQALLDESLGGQAAGAAKETLAKHDQETIATARANYYELRGETSLREMAENHVRQERTMSDLGPAIAEQDLVGVWVLDSDLSIELVSRMLPETDREPAKERMRQMLSSIVHQFVADGTYITEATLPSGEKRTQSGRYEYHNGQLKLINNNGSRTGTVADVRTRGKDTLILQMKGMYSAYNRSTNNKPATGPAPGPGAAK